MDKIIALLGKKMILVIALGGAVTGGVVYVGIGNQKTAPATSDVSSTKAAASDVAKTDSTYVDTQWNQAVGGTAGMPENWPKDAPSAYPGATLMSSLSKNIGTGKSDPSVIYFTDAPKAKVIEYYVKGLTANAWKIEANADNGAGYHILTAKKDTRSFAAFVSTDPKGKTGVTSGVTF